MLVNKQNVLEKKTVNRKAQGVPQSQTAANHRHKQEVINEHAQNKQTHEKHTEQLRLPLARWSQC